jgi:hypothetical protein
VNRNKTLVSSIVLALIVAFVVISAVHYVFIPAASLEKNGKNEIWPLEVFIIAILAASFLSNELFEKMEKLLERILGPHENATNERNAKNAVTPMILVTALAVSMFIYLAAIVLFKSLG